MGCSGHDGHEVARSPAGEGPGGRLPGLDGLRGLAALTVLGGHLSGGVVAVVSVYLFFVLSAFLLTTQFLAWDARDFLRPRRLGHYAQRRAMRVVPLFVLVTLVGAATTAVGWGAVAGKGLPVTVEPGDVADVLRLAAGPEVLWTVAVEFKFYAVLPAIAWVLVVACRGRTIVALALLGVAIAAFAVALPNPHNGVWMWPFVPIFLCGSAAAVLHRRLASRGGGPRSRWGWEAAAWASLAAWAATMPVTQAWLGVSWASVDWCRQAHVFYGGLFAVTVLGVLHGRGALRWLLERPAARAAGAISFSLYLWHMGLIRLADAVPGLPPVASGLLAIAASLAVAWASYHGFEKPILRATRGRLAPRRAAELHCGGGPTVADTPGLPPVSYRRRAA